MLEGLAHEFIGFVLPLPMSYPYPCLTLTHVLTLPMSYPYPDLQIQIHCRCQVYSWQQNAYPISLSLSDSRPLFLFPPSLLSLDQEILRRLEKDKILVFTPSRRVQGRRVVCYDDRFIVKLAYESDGIIVSNDNYRDLANEKTEWKKFIDERLLMYSFVNDKFMPPDDPLGRHGPSLENFLRKRPVIPEHRKQPCPYGKKCTYGHKCKFYHPERGSQPQRSVADELRASAKNSSSSSTSSSKSLGSAPLVKSHSMSSSSSADGLPEPHRAAPKRRSDPGLCTPPYNDLLEERLGGRTKSEARRGSSSSSSSSCFSLQDWRDHNAGRNGSCRAPGLLELGHSESYPTCESPKLGYNSLMRAYSSLNLDGLKCHHPHHHHCSSRYPHHTNNPPPGLTLHPHGGSHHSYPLSQSMGRPQVFSLEDHPSSLHHFKAHLTYLPPHLQHPSVGSSSGCSEDYPPQPPPQTSSPHCHSHSSTLGHNLGGSTWQDNNSLQNSRLYEHSPVRPRRTYPGMGQEQRLASWDSHYQQLIQPCYEAFNFQGTHSPHPQPPSSSHPPPRPSMNPQHQGGRCQDVRDKVFVNLCNIFPPELVKVVMERNPHVMDAQQLAAAILSEKSQARY
ncbi:unnamed protein product [Oncorhynchus mykiss]|uniref:C3H1-type domain-containing protein n=1 Tax=Oncorhynchus mykiss TaxID=8022 RepID=A0A060W0P8_ONCMY|nr:unnamed protein product [Oncorhynchus mykiss]